MLQRKLIINPPWLTPKNQPETTDAFEASAMDHTKAAESNRNMNAKNALEFERAGQAHIDRGYALGQGNISKAEAHEKKANDHTANADAHI